jgi:hypothetical protein
MPESFLEAHPIAFYCDRESNCRWQGFKLHLGLGWGPIPLLTDPWRKAHDRECGGKLIPLWLRESIEVGIPRDQVQPLVQALRTAVGYTTWEPGMQEATNACREALNKAKKLGF